MFLLLVFSLNTVVGFACAISIDMGFNSSHHNEAKLPAPPAHKHDHGDAPGHHDSHDKGHDQSHHTDDAESHHSNGEEQNCCSDDVAKLLQQEKNIAHSLTIDHPGYITLFIPPFYYTGVSFHNQVQKHTRYFVRNYHPPIPDIRIAIQSFQI
jgi:hypothetical protein